MGAYAEAARRRVHLATLLLRPQSGHRPGRRQACQAYNDNFTSLRLRKDTKFMLVLLVFRQYVSPSIYGTDFISPTQTHVRVFLSGSFVKKQPGHTAEIKAVIAEL